MKKKDIILILILLILVTCSSLIIHFFIQKEGSKVEVLIDGQVKHTFSLDEDLEFWIDIDGEKRNLLIIKDKKAWINKATCPDKLCTYQRKISKSGESIICLPHKLVVRLVGDEESSLDAIAK